MHADQFPASLRSPPANIHASIERTTHVTAREVTAKVPAIAHACQATLRLGLTAGAGAGTEALPFPVALWSGSWVAATST